MQTQEQVSHFLHKQEYIANTGLTPGNTDACAIFRNCKYGVLLITRNTVNATENSEVKADNFGFF